MKTKSVLLRILYYSDGYRVESASRLHTLVYLVSEEIDVKNCSFEDIGTLDIYSKNLNESIDDLKSHMLVEISRDDENINYQLTEEGVNRTENLVQDSTEERAIKKVCNENSDSSVKNLVLRTE